MPVDQRIPVPTPTSSARLAVSIVLYEPDLAQLRATLDSLQGSLAQVQKHGRVRADVYLTDHSPRPLAELAAWQPPDGMALHYMHTPSNPGFGAGHNATFQRAAGADFFLVANPDLEFAPDAIAAGLAFMHAHPALAFIAPALVEAHGRLRPACYTYPDLITLALRALGVAADHPRIAAYECRQWDAHAARFDPPLVSGCCLLFRAASYRQLNGFDERYFLYFEDFDLALRARRLGLRYAYCPAMQVQHAGGGVARKGGVHMLHFTRSAWRFFNTHGWFAPRERLV